MLRCHGASVVDTGVAPKEQVAALVLEALQSLSRALEEPALHIHQRWVDIHEDIGGFRGGPKWFTAATFSQGGFVMSIRMREKGRRAVPSCVWRASGGGSGRVAVSEGGPAFPLGMRGANREAPVDRVGGSGYHGEEVGE